MQTVKKNSTSLKQASRWFKSDINYEQTELKIDQSSGVIRDVAVCTVGQAKGHGVSLDQNFVDTVVQKGNEYQQGLKCRFGHPTMSSEALGTYLGRFKNFRTAGTKAIADLYLDDVAKKSPGGDLYSWVLEMAAKNPDQFGSSIVFTPGDLYQVDPEGNKVVQDEYDMWGSLVLKFDDQPLYVTCDELHGTDIVDEPAANDGGLFSSTKFNSQQFAVRVSQFLDANPDIWSFVDKHPDKFKPFLEKYAQYQSKKSTKSMSKNIPSQRRSFISKFANALFSKIAFATSDHTTNDGKNIRIVSVNDDPAVGDEVYIIAEDGSESVAPDGDYTISGGDRDGYVVSVVDGLISAIVIPEVMENAASTPAPAATQSSNEAVAKLKAEVDVLKKQLKAKSDELEAYKKKPLAEHTAVGGDEDPNGDIRHTDKDAQFWEAPWNKKHKK